MSLTLEKCIKKKKKAGLGARLVSNLSCGGEQETEEQDGCEEKAAHGTTRPLRGSPLFWCKGMRIVALKPEDWKFTWCGCEGRILQQLMWMWWNLQ